MVFSLAVVIDFVFLDQSLIYNEKFSIDYELYPIINSSNDRVNFDPGNMSNIKIKIGKTGKFVAKCCKIRKK